MSVLEHLCEAGQSFFDRGYAFGSTGNLSVRIGSSIWVTPTGKPLKGLRPDLLAEIDLDGNPRNANRASKEYPFHLEAYRARPDVNALVHLHSTYSVALSCLERIDPGKPMPSITPYFFMRVAPMAVVPYFRPGSAELAEAVGKASVGHNTLLLRNHGMICFGVTLSEAIDRTEELEETCKLHFLLRGERLRELTPAELADLHSTFVARK
ncbi:MAG: class II aldolase/adducin family protein [Bryobacteraceae bacterium]